MQHAHSTDQTLTLTPYVNASVYVLFVLHFTFVRLCVGKYDHPLNSFKLDEFESCSSFLLRISNQLATTGPFFRLCVCVCAHNHICNSFSPNMGIALTRYKSCVFVCRTGISRYRYKCKRCTAQHFLRNAKGQQRHKRTTERQRRQRTMMMMTTNNCNETALGKLVAET